MLTASFLSQLRSPCVKPCPNSHPYVALVEYLHCFSLGGGSPGACHVTVSQNILARQPDYSMEYGVSRDSDKIYSPCHPPRPSVITPDLLCVNYWGEGVRMWSEQWDYISWNHWTTRVTVLFVVLRLVGWLLSENPVRRIILHSNPLMEVSRLDQGKCRAQQFFLWTTLGWTFQPWRNES